MLITFRKTHYTKKKKKNLSLVSHSTQFLAPPNSFLRCPTNPFLLFQVFNLNRPIQSLQKKKKKKTYFLLSSHFSLLKTFIWDNFFRHKTVVFPFPSITPNFGAQMGQLILFYCYSYIFFTLRNLH